MKLIKILTGSLLSFGLISTVWAGNVSSIFIKKANEDGVNDKLFNFFRTANKISKKSENIVLSPYSILTATAMLERGADGESKKQLDKAFGFDKLCQGYFSEYLNNSNLKVKLNTSNSIWIDRKYKVSGLYRTTLNYEFGAEAFNADFEMKTEKAAQKINSYVAKHTNDLIKDLISSGDIKNASIILLNTIYFKGDWVTPFNKNFTNEGLFYTGQKKKVKIDMMNQMAYRQYFRDKMVSGVELAYRGKRFSMLILLPNNPGVTALNEIIENISHKKLKQWSKSLRKERVTLVMPKCKIQYHSELREIYMRMGVTDIFNPAKADLSKTSAPGQLPLYVSKIIHETVVNVNEEGTEAAGATAIVERSIGAPQKSIKFTVNRPYLFIIRDRVTENILFIGKITNPAI